MAVDTAQKRFSMLNFSWVPGLLVFEPDGAVDADDRAMLLHLYSGIALAGGVTVTPDATAIPIIVPQPAFTLGEAIVVPDAVPIPIVIPQPTFTTGVSTIPDAVAIPIVVPAPTFTVSTNFPATPTLIPIVIPEPAFTVGGTSVTPDSVPIPILVPNPQLSNSSDPGSGQGFFIRRRRR